MRKISGLLALLALLAFSSAGVAQTIPAPVGGTMQSAAGANGNGTSLKNLGGYTTITLQVSGTFVGTINPEASLDNTNFTAIACLPVGGGASVTTFTATGSWRCNLGGAYQVVRARISGWASGTITVNGAASYGGTAKLCESCFDTLTVSTPLGTASGGTGKDFSASSGLLHVASGVMTANSITGLVVGAGATVPTAYGGVTCTNQVLRVLSASGAGTCTTLTSAYVDTSIWTGTATTGVLKASSQGVLTAATAGTDYVVAITAGKAINTSTSSGTVTVNAIPRGHLAGYAFSTAGSSATMTVGAGEATDSTFARNIQQASSLNKTTSAWAVGTAAGCLDTGSIANATWYYFYSILRSDTGVVDVLCSVSATAPTMPTNYDYRSTVIGFGLTNGSAQWTNFVHDEDYWRWLLHVQDIAAANPGNSAVTATLTVPRMNVMAFGNLQVLQTAATTMGYVSDLGATDEAPSSAGTSPMGNFDAQAAATGNGTPFAVRTNTSGAIRYRMSNCAANCTVYIATAGWMYRRDGR